MFRIFSKKPIAVSLIIIAAGLLIMGATFVYYGFHLGIKPCEGLPSDAANCGDADLGGVVFIVVGAPITLFGIVSLLVSSVMTYARPHFSRVYFLKIVYILLAVLIALLLAVLFV
jgi:magnesium-transporting ATPase (P-type)